MAKIEENISPENVRALRELILDEQKLVTYVSLSKDLGVHVNEAKILLKHVVEEIKTKNSNSSLNINFIMSGLSSSKSAQTIVCSESELEAKKSAFMTVFYHHIYSVCLGSKGVDKAALASISKFEDLSLCVGLIKSDTCVKRSANEIGTLKSCSQPPAEESKKVTAKQETIKNLQNGHIDTKNNVVKIHETKSEPNVKSEVSPPKNDKVNLTNGKHNIKPGNKPTKGIASFFTKSNSAPSTKTTKLVQDAPKLEIKSESEVKEESMEVDDEETVVKEIKKEPLSPKKGSLNGKKEPSSTKKEPLSSKKDNKNTNSLSKIKKNAKVDKKRKRVLHVSDSESEGENDPFADEKIANDESDNEIPPTPATNTVKITSGILNPKKKRKIVDKTYTDEEGYILTRKEEVYESCSEDETTDIVKKEPLEICKKEMIKEKTNKMKTEVSPKKAKSTKKVSPPQKGKQGNIMNFFKKI